MDRYMTFNTFNSMLGKKHNYTLPFSDEARAMICEFAPEQMYQIMLELYKMQDKCEESVKKVIANVKGETRRIIGFGVSRE